MLNKIKGWLIGKVIMSKVGAKLVKHAVAAILALLSTPFFLTKVQPVLEQLGVIINEPQLKAGLIVIMTGVFGAVWNYIKHRIFK